MPEFEIPVGNEFLNQEMDYESWLSFLDDALISQVHTTYGFAFNGMETDHEVSGNGNSYTTQFRQYDPRLGIWKSLDSIGLEGESPTKDPDEKKSTDGTMVENSVKNEQTHIDSIKNPKNGYTVEFEYKNVDGDISDRRTYTFNEESQSWEVNHEFTSKKYESTHSIKNADYIPPLSSPNKVTVTDFKVSTDKDYEQPSLEMKIKFDLNNKEKLDRASGPYHVVQTVRTNRHVDSNYNPMTDNIENVVDLYDMDSRQMPYSSHFEWDNNSITVNDILFRRVEIGKEVYFKAQTSLIHVSTNGTITVVKTLEWGFIIDSAGNTKAYGPRKIVNPSHFQMKMINDGPQLYDMNKNSTPFEIAQ